MEQTDSCQREEGADWLKDGEGEAGCGQEEGLKKGFVMGSRTQGIQEILEKCM